LHLLSSCCCIVESLSLHFWKEVEWWLLLELCEEILMINCCCFMLINSLHELLLTIIECEISPFLFECCLYVGNVQKTRSNRWCELIPRVVIGVMLWYVTGWGYLRVLFFLVTYFLISWCWTTFGFEILLRCWCWGLSAEFLLKTLNIFRCDIILNYWKQLFK